MEKLYIYDSETLVNFGQYKGDYISDILGKDPAYLLWCLKYIDWFIIDNNLIQHIIVDEYHTISSIQELRDEEIFDLNEKSIISFEGLTKQYINKNDNKKIKILEKFKSINQRKSDINHEEDNQHEEYIHDLEENWLNYAAGTDDPETLNDVFWNLD